MCLDGRINSGQDLMVVFICKFIISTHHLPPFLCWKHSIIINDPSLKQMPMEWKIWMRPFKNGLNWGNNSALESVSMTKSNGRKVLPVLFIYYNGQLIGWLMVDKFVLNFFILGIGLRMCLARNMDLTWKWKKNDGN